LNTVQVFPVSDVIYISIGSGENVARRRWEEFRFDHVFHVDTVTFVQSVNRKKWNDLAECKLNHSRDMLPIVPMPDQLVHP
jgi:hypothetical protein